MSSRRSARRRARSAAPVSTVCLAAAVVPLVLANVISGGKPASGWETRRLHDAYYSEGSAVGDIDGDGTPDLVSGPFWFPGPGFTERHAIFEPVKFPVRGYGSNFFSHIADLDGDGRKDVLVFGFPGKEARLYRNPGPEKLGAHWPVHVVADQVGHEAPSLVDLIPGGLPEIVCSREKAYGYYAAGDDATRPWTWHAISAEGDAVKPFGHGMGTGDVNGDGRLDVIERTFWYEHPSAPGSSPWTKRQWAPQPYGGGAQIFTDDIDGDGDNDILTSIRAHGHGIAWFEQTAPGTFVRHDITGEKSTDNPFGVCFTQPHAMALADIDRDGLMDFVTGKRWYAHNGKDVGGHQPAVVYWFRATRGDDGIEFVPQLVHDDSGVGVGVTVADLNGDGRLDIVSANKKGLALHLQGPQVAAAGAVERWKTPGGRPQDGYGSGLGPEKALARIEAPDGFAVDLIAAEPDIVQPIAMCFDARGRIWAIEGNTYPQRAPDGGGKDRIVILEDADADGSFETRKVFADGINLASGIEVGFGGVWVGAAPYLLFYPDADRDDRPDGEPRILLDGWGFQDTHETLNSFTWGPDGWLYGCHGVFTHSRVGQPGTPDRERVPLNAGVWRYHPTAHRFEVFAHGTSNPWGVDFNETGDFFISACVIPHFYHMVQGGRYIRQAGQHFNPFTYGEIGTIADHSHYTGAIRDHAFWGGNKANRPAAPTDTSALGGGHAHCGLALYLADEFPPELRGDAFFHNLHGHRVVRETLEPDGSGFTARHRPDFVFSNNHDHIGVGVMLGPDGALYYSDWVDPQTCHHRDVAIWDRTNGRIFRVRHGDPRPYRFDLWAESDAELVGRLASPNAYFARQAQRILQERSAAGQSDREALRPLLAAFETRHAADRTRRLRAFWTAHACGLLGDNDLVARLDDDDPHVRGWAVQFLGESGGPLGTKTLAAVEDLARTEPALVTRRYLASLLQRLPHDQRWEIAAGLLRDPVSQTDRNIPLLVWFGIEPLVETDADRVMTMAARSQWKQLTEFVARRSTATEGGRNALVASLATVKDAEQYVRRGNRLLAALAQLPPVDAPPGWPAARRQGESLRDAGHPAVGDMLNRIGVRFGDAEFFPHWRAVARNAKAPAPQRAKAVDLLQAGGDPQLPALARELLDVRVVRRAAVAALKSGPGRETAEALVSRLEAFPVQLRNDAINLLATRADMALVLLTAVDSGRIPSSLVSPVLLDQFERFANDEITALIERNWVRGAGMDLAELRPAIEAWKKKLAPKVMAKADASRGRKVYEATCGNCHTIFGAGIALGPDLTGSNRADLGYILENVLAPSAVVGRDYMLNIFTMQDGTVVSGMVQERSPEFLKVAMPGGSTADVKVAAIASRQEVPQSLMPPGLFDTLELRQVADLVKYLASPGQVPLTGAAPPTADTRVAPPAPGVTRIEGEALLGRVKATGGTVRAQKMTGFGPGWSGGSQLWWTGGGPDDALAITLPDVAPGTHDLAIFPTTARDYARVQARANGQIQAADLFTEQVLPGRPLRFHKVNVSPGEPLKIVIEITGANPQALPRHMVGIDRVEVKPAK